MKVTVTTLGDDIFVLDVSEELELENFKAFCEIESGVPAHEIVIAFNGRPLMDDKKSLKDHGIRDGDVIILQHMHQSGADMNIQQPLNGGPLDGNPFFPIVHHYETLIESNPFFHSSEQRLCSSDHWTEFLFEPKTTLLKHLKYLAK